MTVPRLTRKDFAQFRTLSSRWRDNDIYGHVNNAVYFEYVDTAVNAWLIENRVLDLAGGAYVGLVVHSSCDFFAPLAFPQAIHAGLRTGRVGRSSVTYEVGLFAESADDAAAIARFVHAYVSSADHKPRPLPDLLRQKLMDLAPPDGATPL